MDFAFLPGDNADDGVPQQYELVRSALHRLKLPVHIITGDHDRKSGALAHFREFLQPELYRSTTFGRFALFFLNAMDGIDEKTFDFGAEQLSWLKTELQKVRIAGMRPLVFVHLYPSELKTSGNEFSKLIRDYGVELVEMGHTHYNELANDGRTIYATTRSTGQIEEGPPGFSITVIDEDVISWKFKQRGAWPFVMIASPSDYRLITRPGSPNQVVRGKIKIRAKALDERGIGLVTCSIDGSDPQPMHKTDDGFWEVAWDSRGHSDGRHTIRADVEAGDASAFDEVSILVSQSGEYRRSERDSIDYENTIGAWPLKGIVGTQLGPNENGTKGPWPSWRGK